MKSYKTSIKPQLGLLRSLDLLYLINFTTIAQTYPMDYYMTCMLRKTIWTTCLFFRSTTYLSKWLVPLVRVCSGAQEGRQKSGCVGIEFGGI